MRHLNASVIGGFKHSLRSLLGLAIVVGLTTVGLGVLHYGPEWESRNYPALAPDSFVHPKEIGQGKKGFVVETQTCYSIKDSTFPDLYVTGHMHKVRSAPIVGHYFYLGTPDGRHARVDFNRDLNDPENDYLAEGTPNLATRRPGFQDWGPWRLRFSCNKPYSTWYMVTEHKPWHGLWLITQTYGPFTFDQYKINQVTF